MLVVCYECAPDVGYVIQGPRLALEPFWERHLRLKDWFSLDVQSAFREAADFDFRMPIVAEGG